MLEQKGNLLQYFLCLFWRFSFFFFLKYNIKTSYHKTFVKGVRLNGRALIKLNDLFLSIYVCFVFKLYIYVYVQYYVVLYKYVHFYFIFYVFLWWKKKGQVKGKGVHVSVVVSRIRASKVIILVGLGISLNWKIIIKYPLFFLSRRTFTAGNSEYMYSLALYST